MYQLELYFVAATVTTEEEKISHACLLMTEDAAIWLRTEYDDPVKFHGLTWHAFKTKIQSHFKPADHSRRARDKLVLCN